MGVFKADEVNAAFDLVCPELKSKYARYPMKYDAWLAPGDTYEGKPAYIAAKAGDEGMKEDYMYCKYGPAGPGYYHMLCKCSSVNLYTRIQNTSAGSCCSVDKQKAEALDTTRLILHYRHRCSRPDDLEGQKQGIDHMVGTKLNPVHGLRL
jgi:hypothetical protein